MHTGRIGNFANHGQLGAVEDLHTRAVADVEAPGVVEKVIPALVAGDRHLARQAVMGCVRGKRHRHKYSERDGQKSQHGIPLSDCFVTHQTSTLR